jgi:hypothetical protein
MDWQEIGKQVQPALVTLLLTIISLVTAFVGYWASVFLARKAEHEQWKAHGHRFFVTKEEADLAVAAVEQESANLAMQGEVISGRGKKAKATAAVEEMTLPGTSQKLIDMAIESAVKDMNRFQAAAEEEVYEEDEEDEPPAVVPPDEKEIADPTTRLFS